MKRCSLQKCVLDDLKSLGYHVVQVQPFGVFFFYDIHLDESVCLPEPNSNGFCLLEFGVFYSL